MPEFTRDPDELGALWEKTGAKGAYMTGTINGVGVVVFRTKFDPGGKAPQWRVLKARPKAEPAHVADEDFIV
jgi:hypothetical protein